MPVAQKIKNVFVDENGNRKHLLPKHRNQIPEAPLAPAAPLTQSVTAQPLTTDSLLLQKEALVHVEEPLLARETVIEPLSQPAVFLANEFETTVLAKEPTIFERIEKPVVVQERIHPVEKEELQQVIYREREQLDVRQITQMLHETEIKPTLIQQRELPAERREAIVERAAPIVENVVLPSTQIDAVARSTVVHAPIIEEVIKKTVIEEVQPVIERDVFVPTLVQNTKPIYEKIVEAPVLLREIRTLESRGVIGGDLASLQSQGFNLGETGRRLSQTFSFTTVAATQPATLPLAAYEAPLTTNGVPLAHQNPLDRNMDGKVDLKDLSGRQESFRADRPMNAL